MHHRFHHHIHSEYTRRGSDRVGRSRHDSQDIQSRLLMLLAEKPRYGYEIVQEATESPREFHLTPTLVYPALTHLEEIGDATSTTEEGGRTRYDITDAGRQHLSAAQGREPTRRRPATRDSNEFWLARRALKSVLRDHQEATTEEQQRIIAILQRATAQILGTGGTDAKRPA